MIEKLITVAEFTTFRDVGKKVDNSKVEECILFAQNSDLQNLLGGFYFDVLKNKDELLYSDLLNGSEFEYLDETYIQSGLKALLSDYTYARYLYMINVNLTPFGATTKQSQDSEALSRNHIKDLYGQAQSDGGIKWHTIKRYILTEPELFARFCRNENTNTEQFSVKTSVIWLY